MYKIKKALDVLSGDCDNPIIKADMIKVLRAQFTLLENSFDASCNHNTEYMETLQITRNKILMTMEDICNANDVKDGYIWWMPGAVHETMWERMAGLYLNAGGTKKELAEKWPDIFGT